MKAFLRDDGVIFGWSDQMRENPRLTLIDLETKVTEVPEEVVIQEVVEEPDNSDPGDETEQEEEVRAIQVGEVAAPSEDKNALIEYAKAKFDVKLDARKSLAKIQAELAALENAG